MQHLELSEIQTNCSRIWTQVTDSIFYNDYIVTYLAPMGIDTFPHTHVYWVFILL